MGKDDKIKCPKCMDGFALFNGDISRTLMEPPRIISRGYTCKLCGHKFGVDPKGDYR